MAVVLYSNKIAVRIHKNCTTDGSQVERCEHLVYLAIPSAGGDGLLLGVVETEQAAEVIASAFTSLFGSMHSHVD